MCYSCCCLSKKCVKIKIVYQFAIYDETECLEYIYFKNDIRKFWVKIMAE